MVVMQLDTFFILICLTDKLFTCLYNFLGGGKSYLKTSTPHLQGLLFKLYALIFLELKKIYNIIMYDTGNN